MAKLLSTQISGALEVTGKSTFKDEVIISGSTVVAGDLVVRGDLTYVESKNLRVTDRLIELNTPGSGSSEVVDLKADPAGIDILGAKPNTEGNTTASIHYDPVGNVFEFNRKVKADLATKLPGSLAVEVKYSDSDSETSSFDGLTDVKVTVDLSQQSASLAETKDGLGKVAASVKTLSDSVYGSKGDEEDPEALFPRVDKLEKNLQAEVELRNEQKNNADKEFKACVHWDVSGDSVVGDTITLKKDTGGIISSNKNGGVPLIKMTKWDGIQIGGSNNEYVDITLKSGSQVTNGHDRITVTSVGNGTEDVNKVAYLSDLEEISGSLEDIFVKKEGDTLTGDLKIANTVISSSGDVKVGKDLYLGEDVKISYKNGEISFEFLETE